MHPSAQSDHARHDLDLIARHAAGDLADSDLAAADRLLSTCTSCADLRRDLVAIAAAIRALPASTSTRDFRLDESQAAALRRGSWLRALLRPFAATRSGLRPMAAAFASLGVAGLLFVTVLQSLGSPASAPAPEMFTGQGQGQGPAASAGAAGGEYRDLTPSATNGAVFQANGSPLPMSQGSNSGSSGGGKSDA